MSIIYPRIVSIRRPKSTTATQVGDVGYNGLRGAADEKQIAKGLRASIQYDRQGKANGMGLPTDAKYQAGWKIFIPSGDAALGLIQTGDIAVDDLGIRYDVFAPYWNVLGYQLRCMVLEV